MKYKLLIFLIIISGQALGQSCSTDDLKNEARSIYEEVVQNESTIRQEYLGKVFAGFAFEKEALINIIGENQQLLRAEDLARCESFFCLATIALQSEIVAYLSLATFKKFGLALSVDNAILQDTYEIVVTKFSQNGRLYEREYTRNLESHIDLKWDEIEAYRVYEALLFAPPELRQLPSGKKIYRLKSLSGDGVLDENREEILKIHPRYNPDIRNRHPNEQSTSAQAVTRNRGTTTGIILYDGAFNKITFSNQINKKGLTENLMHELAHLYDATSSDPQNTRGRHVDIGFDQIDNPFITDYSERNYSSSGHAEDFAEAIAHYVLYPLVLKQLAPLKYQLLKERVFHNIEYNHAISSHTGILELLNSIQNIRYQGMRETQLSTGAIRNYTIPIFDFRYNEVRYRLRSLDFLVTSAVHMRMYHTNRISCRDILTDLPEQNIQTYLMPYSLLIIKHFEELTRTSWTNLKMSCGQDFTNCQNANEYLLSSLSRNILWNSFNEEFKSNILRSLTHLYNGITWPHLNHQTN